MIPLHFVLNQVFKMSGWCLKVHSEITIIRSDAQARIDMMEYSPSAHVLYNYSLSSLSKMSKIVIEIHQELWRHLIFQWVELMCQRLAFYKHPWNRMASVKKYL